MIYTVLISWMAEGKEPLLVYLGSSQETVRELMSRDNTMAVAINSAEDVCCLYAMNGDGQRIDAETLEPIDSISTHYHMVQCPHTHA